MSTNAKTPPTKKATSSEEIKILDLLEKTVATQIHYGGEKGKIASRYAKRYSSRIRQLKSLNNARC